MLLIGLTGSIATGKSTVSRILSQPPYDLPIIDADLLAREVVEPGTPGYAAILSHFSSTTPDLLLPISLDIPENGHNGKGRPLNRPALGRRVFGDEPERQRDRLILNGIVHPAVRKEIYKALLYYYITGHWAVVLDVPLLFESGLDLISGVVMVVAVHDPEVQMRRLRARDSHLSAADARDRVMSQGNVLEKAERAEDRRGGRGVIVWNDGNKEDVEREVETHMKRMQKSSPKWWEWMLLGIPPLGALEGVWNLVMNWLARRRWERKKRKEKAKL